MHNHRFGKVPNKNQETRNKKHQISIVALCHNHAPFLAEALDSILAQTQPPLEVWLVDDASTDGSPEILARYAAHNPTWHLLLLSQNVGNCRAFNQALAHCRGDWIIDFATDDVLLPNRLERQTAFVQTLPPTLGVAYHNAEIITEAGRRLHLHHRPDGHGGLHPAPATGYVLPEILARYFISTPTMLMRRACLLALGGYDETLAYEDFDFWVRAARDWQFAYQNEVLTQKRKHPRQMSARQYQLEDPFLASTIVVCYKALALCRTTLERRALAVRLRWELRQAVRRRRWREATDLYALLRQTTAVPGLLARLLGGGSSLFLRFFARSF